MKENGLEFTKDVSLQFRRVRIPGTIDKTGEITEVSADGKKWKPYGEYWRDLHVFITARAEKRRLGKLKPVATTAIAAHV